MAGIFRIPSLNIYMLFVDIAVKDWVKARSFSISLSSHNSIDPRTVILHDVPEPDSKGYFISWWTLPNLSNNRPHNWVAMELLR